jgi:FAD/FMN-containing dehydrogenase
MTVTPEILRANKEIRDMLWPFDFAVVDNREYGTAWFDTAPLEPFEIVAQRSSGCVYALTGPQRHVLLVTSEGQAGIVAASLQECLELVVAHPYWQDVLSRRATSRSCDKFFAMTSGIWRTRRSATIRKSRSFGRCCARGLG